MAGHPLARSGDAPDGLDNPIRRRLRPTSAQPISTLKTPPQPPSRFDNGMLGTITSGYLDRGYHSHIKIWGSKGWLHLEPMKDQPLTWSTTVGPDAGKVQTWEGSKSPRGYTPIVQSAVRACAEMTTPPVTATESLELRLSSRFNGSGKTGDPARQRPTTDPAVGGTNLSPDSPLRFTGIVSVRWGA